MYVVCTDSPTVSIIHDKPAELDWSNGLRGPVGEAKQALSCGIDESRQLPEGTPGATSLDLGQSCLTHFSLLEKLLTHGVSDFAGYQVSDLGTNGLEHFRGNALHKRSLRCSGSFRGG